jgi:aquaporin NIP
MKKYIAESVGTFGLVFCGAGAVTINEITGGAITHVGIAVTFGLIIMTMIYALGDISGAHFNPAVTLAFAVSKNFPWKEVFPYIASQVLGAFVASVLLKLLFPASGFLGTTLPAGSDLQSFVLEIILTFFLVFVILRVATGTKEQGMFAGLAIGGTILLDAMFGGPISGASMNPARSLAPAIVSGHLEHLWIYLTAPLIGALIAASIYGVLKK